MVGRLRVAVIGYGTGGQAAALMLSRDGHAVEVFERAPVLGPVGAGFLLQPTGQWVLWELGLLDAALGFAAPVARLHGENTRGRTVMDMRYADLDPRLQGLGMQRAALFALLDAAWAEHRVLHRGSRIVRLDTQAGAIEVESGQRHAGFDAIIVADGAGSMLRAQVTAARLDRPYPWGAQWCLVPRGDWPWPDELRQRYRGARRMVGMLPVGTRPGDPVPRMSFFWSLPMDGSGDACLGADTWRADVGAVWPRVLIPLVETAVPGGLALARYRDAVHKRWHCGKAVLLGDAAHAMSPQLGQGVNMALLDALALRDAFRGADTIGEAFARYTAARRAHVAMYHAWSRRLTPLFQSRHDWLAYLRDALFLPLSRLPGSRAASLRLLSGTRLGWFGSLTIPDACLDALDARSRRRSAGLHEAG